MKNHDRMKSYVKAGCIFLLCFLSACGKAFLDEKPDQSQRIPVNLMDYQAMLDNKDVMNSFSCHALGLIGSDESYMLDARYEAFQLGTAYNYQKRAYTWNSMIYEGGESNTDWSRAYSRVLIANLILDGLKNTHPGVSEQTFFNEVKGSALFHRAIAFYGLAQLYCKPYAVSTANSDLGLPLRLEADVTLKIDRSTVAQTYQQMIEDLGQAIDLLPEDPTGQYRPSKAAAHALLSRVFLQMNDYNGAIAETSAALLLKSTLIDLNTTLLSAKYIFPKNGIGNEEVIFFCSSDNISPLSLSNMNVEQAILNSFTANDLRKIGFFDKNKDGRILFKGGYTGHSGFFTGLAVDEMLLTRAECYARLGKMTEALTDLNRLATKRYDKNNFTEFKANTAEETLKLVISERQKELLFRGLRWEDLRRLNKESQFQKTLSRTVIGKLYELPPNDQRYVWPLPLTAIAAGGYIQNPR